jgi:drug/metabolite transporter (DMT)-like permease
VRPGPGLGWQALLALGTVYIVWGSTYTAMRVAVQALPPFQLAAIRFFVAPLLLIALALWRKDPLPSRREAMGAGLVGLFLLLVGNGMVVWSVQYIPSGLSALMVASLPLWTLAFEALLGNGKPTALAVVGLLLGFVGVGTLMWPSLPAPGGLVTQALWAEIGVLGGTVAWAMGSLIGRRIPVPASGLYNSAFSMLSAAVGFTLVVFITHERLVTNLAAVPGWAWGAIAYLVVFGSCVGFSAYAWLVQHVRPDITATYAYVNPVVAMLLGWGLLHEPLTGYTLAGAGLVVASVLLVIRGGRAA